MSIRSETPTADELANVAKTQPNPIEVARSLQRLVQKYRLNQQALAGQVGRKRSTVTNYLRLLTLPPAVQQSLETGEISMGHAKVLLSLGSPDKQQQLYTRILREKLTVREAAKAAGRAEETERASEASVHESALLEQLQIHFGTKVELETREAGGRLVLHYYDFDDLQRLLDKMGTPPL